MTFLHKQAAALTAAVLLLQGAANGLPVSQLRSVDAVRSAAGFSAMLAAASKPQQNPFAELRFSPETGALTRDGKPVGSSFAEFSVSDGTLTAEDPVSGKAVPVTEAAAAAGYELHEEADGTVVLRSPFQSARLIVRSSRKVNPRGGTVTAAGYGDLQIIQYETPAEAYAAYLAYQKDSSIGFAEPDRIRYTVPETFDVETDLDSVQYEDRSWGSYAIGAPDYLAWLQEHNPELPDIKVAVLDTGIYAEHSWFKGRLLDNGIDCAEDSAHSLNDAVGHGTHVAGIICRNTPDSVKLLPVKVISDDGYGTDMMVYCGMMYAVEQKADVINMSLGGDGESPLEQEAVKAIRDAGIICCVSAGNSGHSASYSVPGFCDEVICVGAVQLTDHAQLLPDYSDPLNYECAWYSNTGECVDIAAPGSEITSASTTDPDGVCLMSGTSMAAPFVSAACADLLSCDPKLSEPEVRSILQKHAMQLKAPEGLGKSERDCYGSGMLNLRDAFISSGFVCQPEITVTGALPNGQFYESETALKVSMISATYDAEIYYTTDGSDPSRTNGTLYQNPFEIPVSTCLRAAAVTDDGISRSSEAYISIGGKEVADPYVVENGVLTAYRGVLKNLDLTGSFAEGSLTAIADNLFRDRPIEAITLPDSVTKIGSCAFLNTPVMRITAKGVTELGDYALANSRLVNCELGKLKKIGTGAFQNCTDLPAFPDFSEELTEIPALAFAKCENIHLFEKIPEQVEKIGENAFENLGYYGTLAFPHLKELGKCAFMNADLTGITLSSDITVLEESVFENCASMETLDAPGVTELESYSLINCNSLAGGFDFSKIRRLGRCALVGNEFISDTPISFDALEIMEHDAIGGTRGTTLIFPNLKDFQDEPVYYTENLIWIPNAESVVLGDDALMGLRVSGKLKSAEIHTDSAVHYIIGPAESCIRREAEKMNIPYFTDHTLYADQTEIRTAAGHDFSLYTAYVADDGMTVEWYDITDGTEEPVAGYDMTDTGRCYDLHKAVLTGTVGDSGTKHYRAVLFENGKRLGTADFQVTVAESTGSSEQKDLNYDFKTSSYAKDSEQVFRVEQDILMDEEVPYISLTVYSEKTCMVTLQAVNRNVHVTGTLLNNFDIISQIVSDEVPAKLHDGFNMLRITGAINRHVSKMPLVVRLVPVQDELMQAEIISCDAVYTGEPIRPKFRVMLENTELKEGTDYLIDSTVSFTEPGRYPVTLTGCGKYFGDVTRMFTILPKTTDAVQTLKEGTQTVTPKNGTPVMFSWTPDKEQYLLSKSTLQNSMITVYAADGSTVDTVSGIEYRYKTVTVTPGSTYSVAVSNLYDDEMNPVTFSLVSDFRLLEDLDITVTKMVAFGEKPVYTIKDGDRILKEGTDYTVYCTDAGTHIGKGYIGFRGCGDYAGETEAFYAVAPTEPGQYPDLPDDGHPEPVTLTLGEPFRCKDKNKPGTVEQYRFTAQEAKTYTLTLPDADLFDMTELIYLNDEIPVPAEDTITVMDLNKGDTVTVLLISNYLLNYMIDDFDKPYTVMISGGNPNDSLVIDGVRYRITQGGAVVTAVETTDAGILIPSFVKLSAEDVNIPVCDFDTLDFSQFAGRCTIFTEKGGTVAELCEQYGYSYVLTDPGTVAAGDITGDGVTDHQDVIVLHRCLTESEGFRLTEMQLNAADINQDGMLDMTDMQCLMQQIAPPTETAGIAELELVYTY